MKKQTTLFLGNNLTAAPAVHDFVVDGLYAGLSLSVFNLTGTTPTLQVTATALYEDGFDLAYDAQTANFTAGRTVKGTTSGATGVIVADADGGATGTLTLKRVQGTFYDNEPLVEYNAATPGAAVVNGQLVRRVVEGGVWADTGAVAVSADAMFVNPDLAAGDGDRGRVWPRRFRLKFTEGGSWTDADFAVDLVQSEVK
jgi:hypothetical protein